MSGFGWDCERNLATVNDDVWEPVLQGRPNLRKWKRTPFAWFKQMQAIFGNRLAVGKRSFIPGRQPANQARDDSEDGWLHIDDIIGSTPAKKQSTPQLQGWAQSVSQDIAEVEERDAQAGTKQHNASEGAEQPKRRKTTGITVMQDMTSGLQAIATAMDRNTTVMLQAPKEDVQSIIEGQAQSQVQEENCLIDEGILVMVNMLAEPAIARTYLVFRKPEMRKLWIKAQLHGYEKMYTGFFWDWFIERAQYEL